MSSVSKLLLFILFYNFYFPRTCPGQATANQIIMNPYIHPYTSIGQTLGGASVALADSVPVIFKNPANIGQLRHIRAFVSLNYSRNYIDLSSSGYNLSHKKWRDDFYINSFALSIPLRILNLPLTVAASYNGNQAYHDEVENFEISDKFSAQLYMASLGVGIQTSPNFSIGIGWSRLLSKYQYFSTLIPIDQTSSRVADYASNIYYVGLNHKPNRSLSLGLVFYFPSHLKNENECTTDDQEEQDYSASLRLGLGYRFNDHWLVGLDYGYQWLEAYESGLSTFSTGIGYTFRWDQTSLPIYIMFETILFPSQLNEPIANNGENILRYHQIGMGGGIQFSDFSIYAASSWAVYGDYFYTSPLLPLLPPFS